jgi:transcriptional regulator of acetoin/glycerol metabolism
MSVAFGSAKLEKMRAKAARVIVAGADAARTAAGDGGPARVVLVRDPDRPIAVEVSAGPANPESVLRLPSLERVQWEYIHAALESCAGNVSETARQLGIHRQSLQRMLRRHPPSR